MGSKGRRSWGSSVARYAGAAVALVLASGGTTTHNITTTVYQSSRGVPTSLSSNRGLTINQIYRAASPGVVDIEVTSQASSGGGFGLFGGSGSQETEGEGAGVVYDKRATSSPTSTSSPAHQSVTVTFQDGQKVPAKVLGTDPSTDVAVINVNVPASQLHPIPFADSYGGAGRRPGRRDRQPVQPARDDHAGDRQPGRAQHHGAEQLHDHRRDPDRRGDQPRQLRRPAARRRRTRARPERPDPDQLGFQRRRRLRDSVEHRPADRQPDHRGHTVEHAYVGVELTGNFTGGAQISAVQPGTPARHVRPQAA